MVFGDDETQCSFAYQVVARDCYVLVMQSGRPLAEAKVLQWRDDNEAALRRVKTTRVVFDERDKQASPPWVDAMIWSWLASHARPARAAFIHNTRAEVYRTMARATRGFRGIAMPWVEQVEIMAFVAEQDAVDWVCAEPLAQPA